MPNQRASKWDWFQTALDVLRMEGVDAVRVERLARELGIAKSGFYWHFKDRNDLLDQLVDYWAHEYTAVVTQNPTLSSLKPKARLIETARLIAKHGLNDCEVSMRAWALRDEQVAASVNSVYEMRLAYIGKCFEELGFDGAELESRTRLFVCYQSWEAAMFGPQAKKRGYLKAIERRVDLLTNR